MSIYEHNNLDVLAKELELDIEWNRKQPEGHSRIPSDILYSMDSLVRDIISVKEVSSSIGLYLSDQITADELRKAFVRYKPYTCVEPEDELVVISEPIVKEYENDPDAVKHQFK